MTKRISSGSKTSVTLHDTLYLAFIADLMEIKDLSAEAAQVKANATIREWIDAGYNSWSVQDRIIRDLLSKRTYSNLLDMEIELHD